MNKIRYLLFAVAPLLFFLTVLPVEATEGIVELQSTTGERTRCFAVSILMEDYRYRVVVSCRDLIYPSEPDVFNYVLWGAPIEGSGAVKFGELNYGKVEFKVRDAFGGLYVTKERGNPRNPEGEVVMRGNVRLINFLDGSRTPDQTDTFGDEMSPTPTPIETPTGRSTLVRRLQIILPTLFIAGFLTMVVVYIIYRFRK